MAGLTDGCVKPARGPIVPQAEANTAPSGVVGPQEVTKMLARVGGEAPDFEANAFVEGKGFQSVRLSDYKGQWIVVCFYPGDFTFV